MKKVLVLLMLVFFTIAASAGTVYTGDVYMGKKVVSELDVSDLEMGKVHELYFKLSDTILGQPYMVPVTVFKGKNKGPKVLINAGMHGDELNGIQAAYDVKATLNAKGVAGINGTVTFVHVMNIPGALNNVRHYVGTGEYKSYVDLNRGMDGDKDRTSDQYYQQLLWKNLFSKNADLALEMHTGGGTKFPFALYLVHAYNDEITKKNNRLAELSGVDIAKIEKEKLPGALDEAFMNIGIPALTLEIGAGGILEPEYIKRAHDAVMNILADNKITNDKVVMPKVKTVYMEKWVNIIALSGGMTKYHVKVLDSVKKGQILATVHDPFGNVIHTYTAEADGIVASLKNYPYNEKGGTIGRINYK